jgi:SH3 domain protein
MSGSAFFNNRLFILFCIAFTPFCLISQAEAETRYVSDYLTINLRDNIEKPYQVVAKVKSNDPLTVLEENENYAKVETEEKKVGWIAKQYLTTSLPKHLVIEQLKKEIESLKLQSSATPSSPSADPADSTGVESIVAERDRLQAELKAAMTRLTELQNSIANPVGQPSVPENAAAINSDISILIDKKQQLESEIHALQLQFESLSDGSFDVPDILKEKEDLLAQIKEKDETIASLTEKNQKLADKAMIYWFCAGALVFVVGMFSGKLFARKKTKYSY